MNKSELLKEVEYVRNWFEEYQKTYPEVDHSKHWIILAYNYLDMDMEDQALEMAANVSSNYLKDVFIEDMKQAVKMRNKAKMREESGLDATKEWHESEFFICAVGVINFFIKHHIPGIEKTVRELEGKEFVIVNNNKLEIIQ